MNIVIALSFLVALIFFALSALAVPPHPRFQWQSAGLFFLTLALALGSGALTSVGG